MLYEQLGSSRILLRHMDYFRNQWFWSIAILGNLHKYHGHVYVYCLYVCLKFKTGMEPQSYPKFLSGR